MAKKRKSKIRFTTEPQSNQSSQIDDETREIFTFNITTGVPAKEVFAKNAQEGLKPLSISAFFVATLFGLGAVFVFYWLQLPGLAVVLGAVAVLSALFVVWRRVSVTILEYRFVSKLKRALKKNNLRIFLDEDQYSPLSKETDTKVLKALASVVEGADSQVVGFATDGGSEKSQVRYSVGAREVDEHIMLVFTPTAATRKFVSRKVSSRNGLDDVLDGAEIFGGVLEIGLRILAGVLS